MIKEKDLAYYESLDKRTREYKEWKASQKPIIITPPKLTDEEKKEFANKIKAQFKNGENPNNVYSFDVEETLTPKFATETDVKNHNGQPKGAGDILEKITTKTGIKKLVAKFTPEGEDCGCDERKEKLNDLLPIRYTARCLTEKEYNDWGEFQKIRTLQISSLQVKFVCKLFASVFNREYYQPCPGCSPKKMIGMIEKLDTVHKTYE